MQYAINPGTTTTDSRHQLETVFGDSASVDAFHRQRVSNPVSIFDMVHQYDIGPLLWEDVTTGGASVAHLPNQSAVRLRCGTASGDKVVRQTRAYHRYQPGKSQLLRLTFLPDAPAASLRKRGGYFDVQNGVFLEQISSGLSFVIRSFTSGSAVDTTFSQNAWNLDKLDGGLNDGIHGNPSQITLDPTKTQHLVIDLQWLGVGRVRFGFDIGGKTLYAHEFNASNTLTVPYMTTANLPIRLEIENLAGQAGNHDLTVICAEIASEGGFELDRGFPFSAGNDTPISITTRRPVLSIRPRATFAATGIVNRGMILPRSIELGGNSDTPVAWELVYGGTLTGASFADVNATHSIVQADIAATAITGGFTIARGYVNRQGSSGIPLNSRLPLTLDIAGANPINLSVCGTSTAGATGVLAALNWLEFR